MNGYLRIKGHGHGLFSYKEEAMCSLHDNTLHIVHSKPGGDSPDMSIDLG